MYQQVKALKDLVTEKEEYSMPRSAGTVVENSFVNGLVTEATGLNFPENAVTDTDNCVFYKTGEVKRRLGLDVEEGSSYIPVGINEGHVQTFDWESVSQIGTNNFIVVQIGYIIFFYDRSVFPITSGYKSFYVDLRFHKTSNSSDNDLLSHPVAFSSGNGYLFIAHRNTEPLYIKYNRVTDTIQVQTVSVKIRDFEGIDDGLEVQERPSELTKEHEYNLHNQGWDSSQLAGQNPITKWFNEISNYPSNADVYHFYLNADLEFTPGDIASTLIPINSSAAKGKKIVDAFNIERAVDYTGVVQPPIGSTSPNNEKTVVETVSTDGLRPSQTAFYASRVWWAGIDKNEFASNIYFSKTIESERDFGFCYQQNDPTSEDISDLLPTDGGVVKIPEISKIIFIKEVGNALLVFAENGIWSVSGTDLTPFIADSYQVTKVSDIGAISPLSFVSADNIPFWWNLAGIYTLDQRTPGSLKVVSVTNERIREFYRNIPANSKAFAQGSFDLAEKKLTWLYRQTVPSETGIRNQFDYTNSLCLSLDTGAFYPHSFSEQSPVNVIGLINISGNISVEKEETMTTSTGETITTTSLDTIVSLVSVNETTDAVNKYFVSRPRVGTTPEVNWATMDSTRYVDFYTQDSVGTSYRSFFTTGYRLRGEGQRDFQSNYMTIHSRVEEGSSFFVSGRWDYSNNPLTLRHTTRQQGYKHAPNFEYSPRKLKIRGTGIALQYNIESDSNKPFNVTGWATYDTVNTGV